MCIIVAMKAPEPPQRSRFSAALNALASLVFPEACYVCGGRDSDPICGDCLSSFPLINGPTCRRCGKPTISPVEDCRECRGRGFVFRTAISAGKYEGSLKEAIRSFKYKNGKRMAPVLAGLLAAKCAELRAEVDIVTFVPMSGRKKAERGYNQAKLLAFELGKILEVEPASALRRMRATKPQSDLSLEERRRNVKGAFAPLRNVGGRVLLVDDVFTTGSTANECSEALLKAGATEVMVATVARTVIG